MQKISAVFVVSKQCYKNSNKNGIVWAIASLPFQVFIYNCLANEKPLPGASFAISLRSKKLRKIIVARLSLTLMSLLAKPPRNKRHRSYQNKNSTFLLLVFDFRLRSCLCSAGKKKVCLFRQTLNKHEDIKRESIKSLFRFKI